MKTSFDRENPEKFPALEVYHALLKRWGPQGWWPGETPFEIIVGAILTQNTAWTNVERAIANLAREDLLGLERINALPAERLAALITPAGYYNLKARRLQNFTGMVARDFAGDLTLLFQRDTVGLRETLLAVNGIGPETADSILLYAAARPVFVVDAYTRRFLERHGWITGAESYLEISRLFSGGLPEDVQLFNDFHALIVRLAKEHCRRRCRCEGCPLSVYTVEEGFLI